MDQLDRNYEPMDIDISQDSIPNLSLSTTEFKVNSVKTNDTQIDSNDEYNEMKNATQTHNNLAGQVCPNSRRIKKFTSNIETIKGRNKKWNVFYAFLVAGVSFYVYVSMTLLCSKQLDLEHVHETLTCNLYGQSSAIETIVEALSADVPAKLIFFYGGTGVGKTYASSLIFSNFWHCSNVYHYTTPNFLYSYSNSLMFGVLFCKYSVIIIDGLTINDTDAPHYIKKLTEKSLKLKKYITIVLLYNSYITTEALTKHYDPTFVKKLKEAYNHVKRTKYFIKFNGITQDTLRKCVELELKDNISPINEEVMKKILQNFNASLDGCKNVHSKIKSLNFS